MFLDITLDFSNATLDDFVAWAGNASAASNASINGGLGQASSGISQQLSDFGWILVPDSGDVDWSTIAAVPANMTAGVAVYEIWQMTDTNSGTCPVFMKIEYGSATTNLPGVAITFGTGSDGAGTLTGNVGTRELFNGMQNCSANSGGYSSLFYSNRNGAASTMSTFAMALWHTQNTPYGPMAMMVERSHDNLGADTDLYFTYIASGYFSGVPLFQLSIFKPGSSFGTIAIREPAAITISGALTTTSFAVGTNAPTMPLFPVVGWIGNPLMTYTTFKSGDISDGGLIAVADAYGTPRTYKALHASGGAYAFNFFGSLNNGNGAVGILWE